MLVEFPSAGSFRELEYAAVEGAKFASFLSMGSIVIGECLLDGCSGVDSSESLAKFQIFSSIALSESPFEEGEKSPS